VRLEQLTDLCERVVDHGAAALGKARIGGTNQTAPTLIAALALIAGRAPVLVEAKGEGRHMGSVEHRVREQLQDYDGQCAVMSFNPPTTCWLARHVPGLPRGHLVRPPHLGRARGMGGAGWRWEGRPARALTRMAQWALVGYDVRPLLCRQALGLRAAGVPFFAWTVRTSAERALAAAFADNIVFEAAP